MGTFTKNNFLILSSALALFAFSSCSQTPAQLPKEGLWLAASIGKGKHKPMAVFITHKYTQERPSNFLLTTFSGFEAVVGYHPDEKDLLTGKALQLKLNNAPFYGAEKSILLSKNRDSIWFYYPQEAQMLADTLLYLLAEHQPVYSKNTWPIEFGWQAIDKVSQTAYDMSLLAAETQQPILNEQRQHLLVRNYADSSFFLLSKIMKSTWYTNWPTQQDSNLSKTIYVYPFITASYSHRWIESIGDYCWLVCSVDSTQMTGYFLSKDQLPRFLQFERKPIPTYFSAVMPWEKQAKLAWDFSGVSYEFPYRDTSFFWMGYGQMTDKPSWVETDTFSYNRIELSPMRDALLYIKEDKSQGHLRQYMPLKDIRLQLKK